MSPWGQREKYFDIECGVIGMRIKDGIGTAQPPPDHTIAIKAKEFRLVGFGDLGLQDESLSLSVRSKARGLGLSATTIIEQSGLSAIYQPFYRIGGTLLQPKVESDPEGSDLIEKLIKLGKCFAEQTEVNAPGKPKIITFLFSISFCKLIFSAPFSVIKYSEIEGNFSPSLIFI